MFDFLNTSAFSLTQQEKNAAYKIALHELTRHHYAHCLPYRKILDVLGFDLTKEYNKLEDIPFIPVRLFKDHELLSVANNKIVSTLTSSGTTGQKVSKIFLDQITITNQKNALTSIFNTCIGQKQLPMLILDTKAAAKDQNLFPARTAGIMGFSMFGQDITYAFDENMKLDIKAVKDFCRKYENKNTLLFGFTYVIWEHFYKQLVTANITLPLEKGILLHAGGWKKLINQSVDNITFRNSLENICGIKQIYNYYGMAEQIGSIFMECDQGYFHSSNFSDVIIRNIDFSVCDKRKPGLVQVISPLAYSYPGHSILTEDIGEVFGEDDCACGRLGKYFKLHGRIKNAEVRGCSDTHN